MANHISAKKRSRQNKVKNAVNSQYLSKFRTALNKFNTSAKGQNHNERIWHINLQNKRL